MSKYVSLAAAAAVAITVGMASVTDAAAITVTPATQNPAPATIEGFTWTVDPDNYTQSAWWDPAISPQDPVTVEAHLEAEFGLGLTYLNISGNCAQAAVTCTENGTKSGSIDLGNLTASVFGVHFDNMYIAFAYPSAISMFSIENLRFGVSNIHAFTTDTSVVPLPAGLLLFLTGLAGVGFLGRYKVKRREVPTG